MITLATLAAATAQQVFDQGARHLLKQNQKSMSDNDSGECAYRGPMGLKCAAGCFIGDDEYRPSMEGTNWRTLAKGEQGMPRCVPVEHAELIMELQQCHDQSEPFYWPNRLKHIAQDFNLVFDQKAFPKAVTE